MELLQGPLLNAKRLDEAIKGTKFIKRLLFFYSPSSRQFSEIVYSKVNKILRLKNKPTNICLFIYKLNFI